ncbi:hypothetical protein BH11GEM2_BH11GEM2_19480 [soil metagenome]
MPVGAGTVDARQPRPGAVAEYVITALAVFPALVLIRLFEFVLVRNRHSMPDGALFLTLRGLLADLSFMLVTGAVLALPILAVAYLSRGAARMLHRVVLVLVVVIALALSEYFAVTYVPLGADFFGYSWSDIRETTASSGGGGAGTIVPLLVAAVLAWWLTGFVRRFRLSHLAAVPLLGIFASSVALQGRLAPGASSFPSRLFGPAGSEGPMTFVIAYTVFHFMGFIAAGLLVSVIVHWAQSSPTVLAGAMLLFVAFEIGFYGLSSALQESPFLGALGWAQVGTGNLVAALVMGTYMWRTHPELKGELDYALAGRE